MLITEPRRQNGRPRVHNLEQELTELLKELEFYNYQSEDIWVGVMTKSESTKKCFVDTLVSTLINKDDVVNTTTPHSFLEANSGVKVCKKLLTTWEIFKPSTHYSGRRVAGKWFTSCSQGPGSESTASNVLESKHGYGYDEEESFTDHSTDQQDSDGIVPNSVYHHSEFNINSNHSNLSRSNRGKRRPAMEGDSSNLEKSSIDSELESELLVHSHHHDHDQKGGLRTMPFIIVNEAFERVASYGLLANMIFYLLQVYHMQAVTATTVLSIWSATSNGLSIFGAFIADSYLGRFRVIAIGSLSTLLGMSFLWWTSVIPQLTPSSSFCHENCNPATPTQLAFLFTCFGLISVGSGCIAPCSMAFGADQLKHLNNQRLIHSYFNWYYASIAISTCVAFTVMVYIQDHLGWQVGFAVAALIMLCSALMFLIGSPLYVKVKVNDSVFSGLLQVLVVAFKNRGISLNPEDCYNHSNQSDHIALTDNLRFLNKACVITDTNLDTFGLDPWNLSTVENVESLKSVIGILPLWSSGILVYTTFTQSFPTLQAKLMNRHITSGFEIPAASFSLSGLLTIVMWVAFYDSVLVPFLAKHTHERRGFHPKTRMGIGIVFSIGAMIVSAIVETIRKKLAGSGTTMSAMWLVPQHVLLGLAEASNGISQMEFYYSELPESMSSIAIAMFSMSKGMSGLVGSLLINIVDFVTTQGKNVSWLSSDINAGHLDYYYWLLSFLSLLNFFYYFICYRAHERFSSSLPSMSSHVVGEEGSVSSH